MNVTAFLTGIILGYFVAEVLYHFLTQPSAQLTIYYRDDKKQDRRLIVNCLGSEPGYVMLNSMAEDIVREIDKDAFLPEVVGWGVEYFREWRWIKADKTVRFDSSNREEGRNG